MTDSTNAKRQAALRDCERAAELDAIVAQWMRAKRDVRNDG
jgi:hypothetical protein